VNAGVAWRLGPERGRSPAEPLTRTRARRPRRVKRLAAQRELLDATPDGVLPEPGNVPERVARGAPRRMARRGEWRGGTSGAAKRAARRNETSGAAKRVARRGEWRGAASHAARRMARRDR